MLTTLETDVEKLKTALKNVPEPAPRAILVVASGLPGTGKSHFCRMLAEKAPFLIVESDEVRRILFPHPTYAPEESARVFAAIHFLVGDYLYRRIPVILDATNLLERHRETLYFLAESYEAKFILVHTKAPPELVRQRLEDRARGLDASKSQADWEVYQKMEPTVEKIRRRHFVVDSSKDINPAVEKVLREISRR